MKHGTRECTLFYYLLGVPWGTVWLHGREISVFPKTMVSTCGYFCSSPFTTPSPPLRVLVVHLNDLMGINIHITESKIHISYSENHDSTLMFSSSTFTCQPFQPSSMSLLNIIFFDQFSFRCYYCRLQKIVLRSLPLAAFRSQCQ